MILLKNCKYVITQNSKREVLKNKDILIDGKIKEIGSDLDKSDTIIDCKNKLVLPGMINTHTHAAMSLFRGYADDLPLDVWLKEKIWPLEANLNEDYVYYGSLLAAIEMIKSGTTCFNDMYFFGNGVKKAVEETGIRSFFSQVILDFPTAEFKDSEKAFKIFEGLEKSELFVPVIGTHSIYACSKETLLKAKEIAEKYDSLIHIHLSETKKEVKDCLEQNSLRPAEYLQDIGFLNSDIIAAHSIWLSLSEINVLKHNNVNVSHCPISNTKLVSGTSPVYKMLSRKINVSLGTDSSASNNNLNMFEEMKFATLIQKLRFGKPRLLSVQQGLDMSTINGAKALGLDSGSIEPGKNADLILIDLDNITTRPFHNVVSNLVYSFNGSISDVIINGDIIMQDRKIKTINEDVIERIEEKAREFVKKKE